MKTKQFIVAIILAMLMCMVGPSTYAWDAKIDNICYSFSGSEATVVSGENKYSGVVVIPETVTSDGITYSVTSIGDYAFSGCSNLTSIEIPNSMTSIGDYAFYGCSGLTSVTIPNSVTSIGEMTFSNCSALTSITIPNSVTSIGRGAFSGYSSGLTSISVESGNPNYDSRNHCNAIIESSTNTLIVGCVNTVIPNSVTSIGDYAFYGCSGLTSVTIPNSVTSIGCFAFEGTPWYNNQPDGIVYIGKVAYKYKGTMPVNTSVVIKEGTLSIGGGAFYGYSRLTSISIPNSVTSIGNEAFSDCSGLTSISIPNSVTSIGNEAFSDCSGLTSVTIPNSVTSIGEYAFNRCSGLTSVTIPNSVTSIGGGAFSCCSGLTSVTIPNSVTSIGRGAFQHCSGLTSVTIPNSVTSIGYYAFLGCSGLTSISIPNSVMSIDWGAFSECSGLTSVTFHCEEIGSWFRYLTSIKEVIIGDEVTSIGEYAFYNCSGLTSVKVGFSTPLPIDGYTFSNYLNATLYVPFGSKAAFEAADYWKDFMEIRSYSQDIPYAANATVYCGFLSEIPVVLDSEDEYGGLQFEVTLPSGLTLESLTKSERLGDSFTLTKNYTGYNTYQILLYNIDRDSFGDTEGPLFTMDVRVAMDMKAGDYEIVLRNIVLSDIDANEVTADDSRAVLHVVKVLTGDANLDTRVNVSDIMAVANHILKVKMLGPINEKSADVDRNNRINVTDILGIANIILKGYSPYYAPKAAGQRLEPQ